MLNGTNDTKHLSSMAKDMPKGEAKPTDTKKVYDEEDRNAFRGWFKKPVGRPKGSTKSKTKSTSNSNSQTTSGKRVRGGSKSKRQVNANDDDGANSNNTNDDADVEMLEDDGADSNDANASDDVEKPALKKKKIAVKKAATTAPKKKRVNWARDRREYFQDCIDDWLEQKGSALDVNGDEDDEDGDDHVGKRVAAFREGSIRQGTVTECGKDEETGVIGWNIEFDDEDVVVYNDGDRGKDENFSLKELEEGIQLYEEEGFNEPDN